MYWVKDKNIIFSIFYKIYKVMQLLTNIDQGSPKPRFFFKKKACRQVLPKKPEKIDRGVMEKKLQLFQVKPAFKKTWSNPDTDKR